MARVYKTRPGYLVRFLSECVAMNALSNIIRFFSTRSIPCKCGGHIAEEPTWGNAYYTCDTCPEYATETDFDQRYDAIHRR